MKRLLLIIGLCVVATQGQSKPPQTYPLPPEASKVWTNIEQAEAELRRQYDYLEGQKVALLIGANVPADSRSCKADDKGVVVCAKPETAKAEKK